jgi:hypothetical protein
VSVSGDGSSDSGDMTPHSDHHQLTVLQEQPFLSWTWLGLQFYRDLCAAAFDGWTSLPQVVCSVGGCLSSYLRIIFQPFM